MDLPQIKIITHYGKCDKKFLGDYTDVEIIISEDKDYIIKFGDYYHDKGNIRAEEYVNGYIAAFRKYCPHEIVHTIGTDKIRVADREF